jgi:phage shock protein C
MVMKKLFRSKSDAKVAGICGGIGEMLNVDPTLVRLIAVLLALLTVILPFVVVYIIGWIIVPERAAQNTHVKDPE